MTNTLTLIDWLTRLKQERLFRLLYLIIILGTGIHFIQKGLIEPILYPAIDFQYYYMSETGPAYSPFWEILIYPFQLLPYPTAKLLWHKLNILIILWLIYFIGSRLKKQHVFFQFWGLAYLIPAIVLLNFIPILLNYRTGQANIIMLFLLILCYLFKEKNYPILSGIFLGLAILTKLTPLFLLIYFLIKKKYLILLSTLMTVLILCVLTLFLFGKDSHIIFHNWITTYPFVFIDEAHQLNNISLFSLLWHFLNPSIVFPIFIILIGILLYYWYQTIRYPVTDVQLDILQFSWTVALIPILTHYTQNHHLVLLAFFYSAIWLISDRNIHFYYWILILLSWLLINLAFYFKDLFLFPHQHFLWQYQFLYGAILLWLTGGVILNKLKYSSKTL